MTIELGTFWTTFCALVRHKNHFPNRQTVHAHCNSIETCFCIFVFHGTWYTRLLTYDLPDKLIPAKSSEELTLAKLWVQGREELPSIPSRLSAAPILATSCLA